MPKMSLEQVGRRAGVSRSTVSRVVNGEGNVSPEVRRRVLEVIEETGYRPHAAARSLASSRTGLLGLVIPSAVEALFDDPYFGRLMLGVTRTATATDRTVALFTSEPGEEARSVMRRVVNPGLVDGVIVTATRTGEPLLEQLLASGTPHVVVGRPDDDRSVSVDADNRGGGALAAQHLVGLGRRRLAVIAAPENNTAAIDRREGFTQAVHDAGLPLHGQVVAEDWSQDAGEVAMRALLAAGADAPDAVFVATDKMAIGALRAIGEAGLRCPQDVAVVGFDGFLPASRTQPALTSVAQPVAEVGEQAVRLLLELIDGVVALPRHDVLPTELLVRASCGAPVPAGVV